MRVEPFHLEPADADELAARPEGWYERLGIVGNDPAHFILMPDPYSCDAGALLSSLDVAFPDSRKIGGLASGGSRPGENALFIGDSVYPDGAAGVLLDGNMTTSTPPMKSFISPTFIEALKRLFIIMIFLGVNFEDKDLEG